LTAAAIIVAVSATSVFAQEAAPFNQQHNYLEFSFDNTEWKEVVTWFAEQTGYSWQPISKFPKGSFTFDNKEKYSPIEALDQLNYALRLLDPPYTIIRNRNQLILTEASQTLPTSSMLKQI